MRFRAGLIRLYVFVEREDSRTGGWACWARRVVYTRLARDEATNDMPPFPVDGVCIVAACERLMHLMTLVAAAQTDAHGGSLRKTRGYNYKKGL